MNMYKNLGQETQRNITGNKLADKVIIDQFERMSVISKSQLKKVFWKKFKKSFRKSEGCLSIVE